ncbi:Uncharacterized protein APZ42_007684 [Daphnia magna]|uniref:Uncharacterized protein n=1 Tax=Daphnia magna TaxID=35525 RepID=A0A164F5G2_9CRUS|nr:Uncharacterized protein APZ42_007684 [Daphnia magna]
MPTSEVMQLMEIEAKLKQKLQILAANSTSDWIFRTESPGKATEMIRGVEVSCLSVHEIAVAENFILKLIQKRAHLGCKGATHPSDWKNRPGPKRTAHRSTHPSSIKREDCRHDDSLSSC